MQTQKTLEQQSCHRHERVERAFPEFSWEASMLVLGLPNLQRLRPIQRQAMRVPRLLSRGAVMQTLRKWECGNWMEHKTGPHPGIPESPYFSQIHQGHCEEWKALLAGPVRLIAAPCTQSTHASDIIRHQLTFQSLTNKHALSWFQSN